MTTKHWSHVTPDEWPSVYFKPQEIACRATGLVLLTAESRAALRLLDDLRRAMGHPLLVNSGYRSPAHNAAVGGAKASKHLLGIAFDIAMTNVDPHRFEAEARKLGFNGIGIYPPQKNTGARNFIHIDTRTDRWRGAQWGEFPPRPTRFAPEPVPTPMRTAVRDASPVITAGAAAEAALAAAEPALREAAPWLPAHLQGGLMLAAIALGLGLALWRITHRRHQGE